MASITELYNSLSERRRPEDVAEIILSLLDDLTPSEKKILNKASRVSLKNRLFGYTSMLQEFAQPIGAEKQVKKAIELFKLEDVENRNYSDLAVIEDFVQATAPIIHKSFGENNFVADRLNKSERKSARLDISKRSYNKKWRLLKRIEKKLVALVKESKKREFQQISKHGLAHRISHTEFIEDLDTACFVAYFTARSNLRSEFTIFGQQRAYDEVSDMLFKRLEKKEITQTEACPNWWIVSHVYPSQIVLGYLSEARKGELLGKWTSILEEIALMLREVWDNSDTNRTTMIVRRGNDSTTWNNTAGAWNKARDHWMNLIYATGTDFILEELCFGKVLRLMAADVVAWHRTTGGQLDPNTFVWNKVPLPWKVFSGERYCDKSMVTKACKEAGIDPAKSGWIAPRVHGIAQFRPTPELVHGVTVSNPFLASAFKRHRYFSGKEAKPFTPEDN